MLAEGLTSHLLPAFVVGDTVCAFYLLVSPFCGRDGKLRAGEPCLFPTSYRSLRCIPSRYVPMHMRRLLTVPLVWMKVCRLFLKQRRVIHRTTPRVTRHVPYTPKFTCSRHPYNCAASVAQLLSPLLLSNPEWAAHLGSLGESGKRFLLAMESVPANAESGGPIHKDVIQTMGECLSNSAIEDLHSRLLGGALCVTDHELMNSLWTPELRDRYGRFLVAERAAHVSRKRTGEDDPRFEAGLFARSVFAPGNEARAADTPCASLGGVSTAPRSSLWSSLIDQYTQCFADRSCLHELENLPQEIALGEILADCLENADSASVSPHTEMSCGKVNTVVDAGGGNGFLSAAVGERLQCRAVIVDPYYPSHSVDCCPSPWADVGVRQRERLPRSQTVSRVKSFFAEIDWDRDIMAEPSRCALIAKHLCGSGVDQCLRTLERQNKWPRVLILVPCCFLKIEVATYCNAPFLRRTLHIASQEGFNRCARFTDWNMSCTMHAKESELARHSTQRPQHVRDGNPTQKEDVYPYRRVGAHRSVSHTVPCMHALSQMVEAVINHGRVLWLQDHGYRARVVNYVPSEVTPKCKCIVAIRNDCSAAFSCRRRACEREEEGERERMAARR